LKNNQELLLHFFWVYLFCQRVFFLKALGLFSLVFAFIGFESIATLSGKPSL